MINLAQDSDGTTFQIWKQDQMNSCGIASIWMARGLVRQSSFAEDEWSLAQRVYRTAVQNALAPLGVSTSGPMTLNPRAFARNQDTMANAISRFGFFAAQIAAAVRAENIRCNHVGFSRGVARQIDPRIEERKPAIALVYWSGGGGHFVVAAKHARNSNVVFLDPWSGDINEQPNDGSYFSTYGSAGAIGEVLYLS